jgi:hypothetical protein
MAVDLFELVESLRREVSPPGEDLFPNATDDDFLGNLQDAFWEARLDGLLEGYTESDGSVTPVDSGDDDLTRDLQQLIVFYAGFKIVRNHLRSIKTMFRAQAGPVEFETQQSANVLKDLLLELKYKRDLVLTRLSDLGVIPTAYIDALSARDESLHYGDTYYVSG